MDILDKRYKQTTLLSVFFASTLVGVAVAKVLSTGISIVWVAVGLILLLASLRRKKLACVAVLVFVGICTAR